MQTIQTSIWAIGSTSNGIHLTFESFNGTDPIFPKNNTLLHPSRAFFPTMRGAKRGDGTLPVYRELGTEMLMRNTPLPRVRLFIA